MRATAHDELRIGTKPYLKVIVLRGIRIIWNSLGLLDLAVDAAYAAKSRWRMRAPGHDELRKGTKSYRKLIVLRGIPIIWNSLEAARFSCVRRVRS